MTFVFVFLALTYAIMALIEVRDFFQIPCWFHIVKAGLFLIVVLLFAAMALLFWYAP